MSNWNTSKVYIFRYYKKQTHDKKYYNITEFIDEFIVDGSFAGV